MDWITCPGCGLKHSPRPDGVCPRCRTRTGAAGPQPPLPPNPAFARPTVDAPSPPPPQPMPTTAWGAPPPMPTTPVERTPGAVDVTVGSLLSRTFAVWWANVGRFAAVMLTVAIPAVAVVVLLGLSAIRGMRADQLFRDRPGLIVLIFVFAFVIGLVYFGGVTAGVLQHLAGRRPSIGAMLSSSFGRLWALALTGLAVTIVIWIGAIVLLVPGIYLGVALSLAMPVVMAEQSAGVGAAFSRSFALTKGSRLTLFLLFLVLLVGSWVAGAVGGAIPALLAPFPIVAGLTALLNLAFQVAISPIFLIASAVAYHDLRVAKEGVDTSKLAEVFE